MSVWRSYFKGWTFRTSRPSLVSGSEVDVFVSRYEGDGVGLALVGDTRLYVTGIEPEHVEKQVRVAVTEFDEEESVGRGEFREVVGRSSYTG